MDLTADRVKQIKCGRCGAAIDTARVKPLSTVSCPSCQAEATVPAGFGSLFLVKLLGAGTSGIVCLALDDKLQRQVAVKILKRPEGEDEKAFNRKYLSEARSLARLNHPNVVQVYSIGEHEGQPYIEMELVTGGQLDKRILQGEPPSEVEALRIAIGAAEGLKAAQGVGLIHRDVKPGNILLDRAGTPKLLDFGSAIAGKEHGNGAIVGTPYYVAPEVVRKNPADLRSDIYSLGASLYHLIAGQPPFTGNVRKEVILKRLKQRAPDLRETVLDITPATADTVAHMLEANPDDRPQTYDELIEELHGALAAAEDAAEQQSVFAGAADTGQRPTSPAASAATEAPDASLAAAATTAAPRVSSSAERFKPKPAVKPAVAIGIGVMLLLVVGLLAGVGYLVSRGNDDAAPDDNPAQAPQDGAASSSGDPEPTGPLTAQGPTTGQPRKVLQFPADQPKQDAPQASEPAEPQPEPEPLAKADDTRPTDPATTEPTPTPPTPDTTPEPEPAPATPADTTPAKAEPTEPAPSEPAPQPKPEPTDTRPEPTTPDPEPATPTPQPEPEPAPPPKPIVTPPFQALVNFGGEAHTDADGAQWVAAQPYQPGPAGQSGNFGHVGGRAFVTNRIDDPLLSTYLYGLDAVRFDLPNGRYKVTLLFAEPAVDAAGERVFTVAAEGEPLGDPVDAIAEAGAGKAATRKAVVTVEDGRLDITFQSELGVQFVSAVRVEAFNE